MNSPRFCMTMAQRLWQYLVIVSKNNSARNTKGNSILLDIVCTSEVTILILYNRQYFRLVQTACIRKREILCCINNIIYLWKGSEYYAIRDSAHNYFQVFQASVHPDTIWLGEPIIPDYWRILFCINSNTNVLNIVKYVLGGKFTYQCFPGFLLPLLCTIIFFFQNEE